MKMITKLLYVNCMQSSLLGESVSECAEVLRLLKVKSYRITLHSSSCCHGKNTTVGVVPLTLTHAAKGPKGLSCFEKQTAKHFLKLKKFKNMGIPGKLF